MAAPGLHIPPPPLTIVLVSFVLLTGVELCPVHGFDMLPQRARVRVTLRTTRRFADVRLLQHSNVGKCSNKRLDVFTVLSRVLCLC